MGHDPPSTPPTIHDDLWYAVYVYAYQDVQPGCVGTQFEESCCVQGWRIISFMLDEVCVNGYEICVFSGFTAQQIHNIAGPFNTRDACFESLE